MVLKHILGIGEVFCFHQNKFWNIAFLFETRRDEKNLKNSFLFSLEAFEEVGRIEMLDNLDQMFLLNL